MDATNVPLRLIECIESMKNDVKRKIGMRDHHRAMYARFYGNAEGAHS